ncbi:hypothetical protein AK88_03202 [Plasmodium fragile]|uniref:RAP domain-containing protein n=1 Tax=Plasmodium fragile TaxID=5857 RepID=A0A0D9QJC9_PLAFR|nr:uncharacterized protein AK88_03202 [Plasmodium fragile]KJP87155.1 hypothetical protein AK88_03202 [Plasmodium fragile]
MKRLPVRSLRARLVQYSASRFHLNKCSYSSSNTYEPFAKWKNEGDTIQAQHANVAGDDAVFEDVPFDDSVATSLTFDITVDEEKWRQQEEMEYQRFMSSVGNAHGEVTTNTHAHSIERSAVGHTDVDLLKGMLHKGDKNATSIADAVILVNKNKNILLNLEEREANSFFNQVSDHVLQMDKHSLIDLMRGLSQMNMKNRIRDLCYEIATMLKGGHMSRGAQANQQQHEQDNEQQHQLEIKLCMHCIAVLNKHSLYFSEFYEYMSSKVSHLDTDALVSFAEECYKHSLRTKHYLDRLVPVCVSRVEELNLVQVKSLFHSFHRFCKEYTSFYDSVLDAVVRDVPHFDLPFCQLVLKVATNFKHPERYVHLINLVSSHIRLQVKQLDDSPLTHQTVSSEKNQNSCSNEDAAVMTCLEDKKENNNLKKWERSDAAAPHHMSDKTNAVTEMVRCLKYLEHNKKHGGEVKEAVNDICDLLQRNTQVIGMLDVEDVVHAISCFSSYNKRIVLYNNLLDVLCERSTDLLHAKNISLWIHPILSLAKISWFHKNYLRSLFDHVKDIYLLSRLSAFQILKVLSSIVKTNVYDEQVYKVLIEQVYKEWDIIKVKMVDVATFLWSCAYVNIIYKPLFDSSYTWLLESLSQQSCSTDNHLMSRKNCLVNITWSYIVANYHKTKENFHLILNATFVDRNPDDSQAFKRLHQIADACFSEIPHCLVDADALDCMYKYCMHDKCRTLRNDFSVYKKEKDALKMRNRIISELTHMLKCFEVSYELQYEPYQNSPYIIDILLNEEMKIGICVFGKEHLMRTLETANWDHMNSGFVSLQMRVLHAHGWKIIPINGGQWLQMNSEQKKALLRENFQRYSVLI